MIGILRETPRAVTTGQMQLEPLAAFEDNWIWLLRDAVGHALVVDPGNAAPVFEALGDAAPTAILLTHHHGDHIGGVAALLERWPGVAVHAPDDVRIPYATQRVGDGVSIDVGTWQVDVIAVPGHTRSHVAFHGAGLLFSGDTLFSLGCGRLFEGSPAQMHASLTRLAALPPETLVCCGHEYTVANARFALAVEPGNTALQARAAAAEAARALGRPTLPTPLASELASNPFLRCGQPAVRAAASAWAGRELASDVDVFAALRAWKDVA